MTQKQILKEVETSNWQPKFKFTDNLDAVVDSILLPHEDYVLNLHDKVKEIIEREIEYANQNHETYSITFADICNWQKELFEYKVLLWSDLTKLDDEEDFEVEVCSFPNLYINLGLRSTTVKVGNFTPPHPMFLEDLKVMCFPLKIDSEFLTLPSVYDNGLINGSKIDDEYFKYWITEWYKIFQTVHYFEDLNGRLGGIVINILSYILTNKYLINEQYSKKNSRWI